VAHWVLVFSGGRLLAAGVPTGDRPDLAEAYDKRVEFSGYRLTVSAKRIESLANPQPLRAFAVIGNRASELTLSSNAKRSALAWPGLSS
jgi:hypothetical protein